MWHIPWAPWSSCPERGPPGGSPKSVPLEPFLLGPTPPPPSRCTCPLSPWRLGWGLAMPVKPPLRVGRWERREGRGGDRPRRGRPGPGVPPNPVQCYCYCLSLLLNTTGEGDVLQAAGAHLRCFQLFMETWKSCLPAESKPAATLCRTAARGSCGSDPEEPWVSSATAGEGESLPHCKTPGLGAWPSALPSGA